MGRRDVNVKQFVGSVIVTAIATFLAAVLVTAVWNLVREGSARPDWATAIVLAVFVGIAVPLSRFLGGRRSRESRR